MSRKRKIEKQEPLTRAVLHWVTKFLKIADKAITTGKEIKFIGELKLPFGLKPAKAFYNISFKPLKRTKKE